MDLKDYIIDALRDIPDNFKGTLDFDIGVEPNMKVNDNSENRVKFSVKITRRHIK